MEDDELEFEFVEGFLQSPMAKVLGSQEYKGI